MLGVILVVGLGCAGVRVMLVVGLGFAGGALLCYAYLAESFCTSKQHVSREKGCYLTRDGFRTKSETPQGKTGNFVVSAHMNNLCARTHSHFTPCLSPGRWESTATTKIRQAQRKGEASKQRSMRQRFPNPLPPMLGIHRNNRVRWRRCCLSVAEGVCLRKCSKRLNMTARVLALFILMRHFSVGTMTACMHALHAS